MSAVVRVQTSGAYVSTGLDQSAVELYFSRSGDYFGFGSLFPGNNISSVFSNTILLISSGLQYSVVEKTKMISKLFFFNSIYSSHSKLK